jgi:hypothetical protein
MLPGKIHGHMSPVSPDLLLGITAGYCQRAVVDEAELIITQIGMHSRSEIVSVYGAPCVIPPRNSNSKVPKHIGKIILRPVDALCCLTYENKRNKGKRRKRSDILGDKFYFSQKTLVGCNEQMLGTHFNTKALSVTNLLLTRVLLKIQEA